MKNEEQKPETDFPGYPHYPATSDITHPENGAEKISLEELEGNEVTKRPESQAGNAVLGEDETLIKNSSRFAEATHSEAEVTEEERMLLDQAERGIDESDDEMAPLRAHLDETDDDGDLLNEASGREEFMGDDLVIPGAELDDAAENIGAEDEENNFYSLDDNNDRRDN